MKASLSGKRSWNLQLLFAHTAAFILRNHNILCRIRSTLSQKSRKGANLSRNEIAVCKEVTAGIHGVLEALMYL